MNLKQLRELFAAQACELVVLKKLSPNDNPKHGIYLSPGLEATNLLPHGEVTRDGKEQPYASLNLFWTNEKGERARAPRANLVFYPQYPEVRLSGFLAGCSLAPSALLNERTTGRLLFLGIGNSDEVVAWACGEDHPIAREVSGFLNDPDSEREGVLTRLPLKAKVEDADSELLDALALLHEKGWVSARTLLADGTVRPTRSRNAGGLTLEAELGVPVNSSAKPDFRGWELKSLTVAKPDVIPPGKRVTVITPNPEAGYFATHGVEAFIRRYGYADQNGVVDRLNVGGISSTTHRAPRTGLILNLTGVESVDQELPVVDLLHGEIQMTDLEGRIAAAWPFPKMLEHWERKHAMAAYVPACRRTGNDGYPEYQFGRRVWLGRGADFLRFLACVQSGAVYQDPGHKLEGASGDNPRAHSRSQFRIRWADLGGLYAEFREVSLA